MEALEKISTCRWNRGIRTILVIDEADYQLAAENQSQNYLKNIMDMDGICGVIFVTATFYPLIYCNSPFLKNRTITTLDPPIPIDYIGFDKFVNKYALKGNFYNSLTVLGNEKLGVVSETGDLNGIQKLLNEYLDLDLDDDIYRNGVYKVHPIHICMPTPKINVDFGCVDLAKSLSSGSLPGVFGRTLPVCVVSKSGHFHVYDYGVDIYEYVASHTLPDVLERYFEEDRHLVIFGWGTLARTVTAQFRKRRTLGVVVSISVCFSVGKNDQISKELESVSQQASRACGRLQDTHAYFKERFNVECAITEQAFDALTVFKQVQARTFGKLKLKGI